MILDLGQERLFFSIFSFGHRWIQVINSCPFQYFPKTLPFQAILLIVIQTTVYYLKDFPLPTNARQFRAKPRMSAKFSADQDPIASGPFLEGPGRTDGQALPARKTLIMIDDRPMIIEGKSAFPADLNTGPTLTAGFIR